MAAKIAHRVASAAGWRREPCARRALPGRTPAIEDVDVHAHRSRWPCLAVMSALLLGGCTPGPSHRAQPLPTSTVSRTPSPNIASSCAPAPGDRCTSQGELGPWEFAHLRPGQRSLLVHFDAFCGANAGGGYHVRVRETPRTVWVWVLGPRPVGNLCAGPRVIVAPLTSRLGRRDVRDGFDGRNRVVGRDL